MTSILFTKLHKLRNHYKQHGLFESFKYIYSSLFGYYKYAIFEKDLSIPFEEAHAKIPVSIKLLCSSEKDIDRLTKFWPDTYAPPESTPERIRELIVDRLAHSEECLIAEYQGKIIGMTWLGFQNTHLYNPYIAKKGIGPDEVLGYNTYCDPEYRGNNIQSTFLTERAHILKNRGYKKTIGYVYPHNYFSFKNIIKYYGEPMYILRSIYVFKCRLDFLKSCKSHRPPEIQ